MITMWHRWMKAVGLVFIGLLVLGGIPHVGVSVDDDSVAPGEASKEITIVGSKMEFSPSEVTADVGEEITITLQNKGRLPHNIGILKKGASVEDFGEEDLRILSETIQPEESVEISFTIDKPGEYTFVCNIPGHARAGMTGTLVIQ